jgi:choline kinase
MIGMVLAAGAGRRLRPDTDTLPKTLLPVHGSTTILDLALRNLAEVGLREAVIVVGYAAAAIADRAAELERRHGLAIELVHNDRAQDWNNAYSLWLAREYFGRGVLLVNGDTVHPVSVEKTLLAARFQQPRVQPAGSRAVQPETALPAGQGGAPADVILAIDNVKRLADEEMKVVLNTGGRLARITKQMDPAQAHGEYIGATLIEAAAAAALSNALEATWRRDPGLYYEDGYQELADCGGEIAVAPIGAVDWVEVDNHADLRRAREIAPHC